MSAHVILPCALTALFSHAALATPSEHPGNAPPEVESVGVIPIAQGQLGCLAMARDAEDDPVAFRYQWYVDGEPVSGAEKEIFHHRTVSAQRVQCEVVPDDGRAVGPAMRSPVMRTLNRAPVVERVLMRRTPNGMRCQAEAHDPDGDAVQIRYGWMVNQQVVSLDDEHLPVPALRGDTVHCFAVARDAWAESAHEGSPPHVLRAPSAAPLRLAAER
jgi:hypothetical protein